MSRISEIRVGDIVEASCKCTIYVTQITASVAAGKLVSKGVYGGCRARDIGSIKRIGATETLKILVTLIRQEDIPL